MPFPDPRILSSRQQAFRKPGPAPCRLYHDKTRVNMSFHDTPQQPLVQPAAFRPERSRRDRTGRRGAPGACLARGQSGAQTAPAPTRARARA